ncbi:2-methylcitrate synthase [Helicobacter bizzozeronii CCUG 35545]|nr:2-methylcitrate synthase [Helicobacter bizzozeronii CCUG 35545]
MSAGLAGVVAGSSAICQCAEGLTYRGYAIEELASLASFEEVAHLLLVGHLPNQAQLESFKAQLQQYRELPMGVKKGFACARLRASNGYFKSGRGGFGVFGG